MPAVALPASNLAVSMGNVSMLIEKVAYVARSKAQTRAFGKNK
jgi:hypothetical protein